MKRVVNLVALVGLLGISCLSLAVIHTEEPARAAEVTSGYCSANVSPSTGVMVSVASNGDCVVSFASNTTVTWTRPANISTYQLLVVGGGGGGGGHPSGDPGGGGGGGVVHVPSVTLTGSSFEVKAGIGGIGNDKGPCGNPWFSGRDGENSIFGPTVGTPLISAYGGAGGGGACDVGRNGGSGGGGHCSGGPTAATQGLVDPAITGAVLYGMPGGKSDGCGSGAGGGGGALTAGQDGTALKAGDGGEGIAIDALGTGTPVVYASGGGGGGGLLAIPAGAGGTNGGDGKQGDGATNADNNGVDGTGSGGGAQLCPTMGALCPAGKGGDGIIIVRYAPIPIAPSNVSAPIISGTVTVGSTLNASKGTWGGTPSTNTYQWQRGNSANGTFTAITDATTSSYVVALGDATSFIRVVVTATNNAGTASANSSAVGPVPTPVVPTTTLPTTTTTSPATTTTVITVASPVETSAAPLPIIASNVSPLGTVKPTRATTASTVLASTTTLSVTTTLPSVIAPSPPALKPGEATVVIDGKTSSVSVSRSDDQLVLSQGEFTSTISSVSSDGVRRPLDSDGNVHLEKGDSLAISAAGFTSNSDIEVWMLSEPTRLGVISTSETGSANAVVNIVNNPESGSHRIVLRGTSRGGLEAVLAVGVLVGTSVGGVTASKVLIVLPIVAAIIAALVIPTRRRRKSGVTLG